MKNFEKKWKILKKKNEKFWKKKWKILKKKKKKNTISELLKILDKKNILNNQKYLIKVKKNIPQKAGLGGGSMNASAIIRFFISKKTLNFSKKNLIRLTRQIGLDVQLGINNKNKILYSNGKLVTSIKKIGLFVILIKPKFGCSTKEIYRNVRSYSPKKLTIDKKEGIQSRGSIFSMIVFLDSQNKNRGNKVRLDLLKESTI